MCCFSLQSEQKMTNKFYLVHRNYYEKKKHLTRICCSIAINYWWVGYIGRKWDKIILTTSDITGKFFKIKCMKIIYFK